jgi:hypothetical protein
MEYIPSHELVGLRRHKHLKFSNFTLKAGLFPPIIYLYTQSLKCCIIVETIFWIVLLPLHNDEAGTKRNLLFLWKSGFTPLGYFPNEEC